MSGSLSVFVFAKRQRFGIEISNAPISFFYIVADYLITKSKLQTNEKIFSCNPYGGSVSCLLWI